MTPPEVCLNCHGAPYASPYGPGEVLGPCQSALGGRPAQLDCLQPMGPSEWREDPRLRRRWQQVQLGAAPDWLPQMRLPSITSSAELPLCSAWARWPEELQVARSEAARWPWWVRSNYEAARTSPPPARIDVRRATLEMNLRTWPWATLPLVRGWVFLASQQDGRLRSRQVIEENELDLLLTDLVEFENIQISIPRLPTAFPIHQISTGDFGGLHAIAEVPTWWMFFLQPFMVPVPPPGHDRPRAEDWEFYRRHPDFFNACLNPSEIQRNPGLCPQPLLYPDRSRPTAQLDLNLLNLLPTSLRCRLQPLLDDEGRLPQYLDLEDLLRAGVAMRDLDCPASSGRSISREELLDFIHSGTLVFRLEDLQDLFIPGVLDLGPSRGTVRARLDFLQTVNAVIQDFEINLDPMGFGDRERIHAGTLTPGARSVGPGGIVEEPGIQLHWDLETGELRVRANLQIEIDADLPIFGESELSGQLILDIRFGPTSRGLRPLPMETTFALRNLEVRPLEEDASTLRLNELLLTDDPRRMDPDESARGTTMAHPLAVLHASGERSPGRAFDLRASLPLPLAPDGSYDLMELLTQPELEMAVRTLAAEGRNYRGRLRFGTYPLAESPDGEVLAQGLGLRFDADSSTQLDEDFDPLIRGGRFDIALGRSDADEVQAPILVALWEMLQAILGDDSNREAANQLFLSASAQQFHWGPVHLNDVEANLEIDHSSSLNEDGGRFLIPSLAAVANVRQGSRGLLRGPIRIAQAPEAGLYLVWNRPERRLEMQGLDLQLEARRIFALPQGLLRDLGYPGGSLGLDGRLQGNFTMYFPEEMSRWHGRGEIRLRGDSSGDVYLLNAQGRRVHPPLIRDTRWRWRRIDGIRTERGYALGDFNLDLLINPEILISERMRRRAGFRIDLGQELIDERGRRLEPYELGATMQYDNQPLLLEHFRNRIVDYLLSLFRNYAEQCATSPADPVCDLVEEACEARSSLHPVCEQLETGGTP